MAAKRQEMSGTLVLGRYRIVEQLARGGMGVVYLARTEGAQGFTRPVIIKRIIPDLAQDDATAKSFVREARILANLQHPGIVNVIDFDEEDGAYVMVLEYVHGYNLGQWHKYVVDTRKELPIDYAIYIMTRVLDALHYAHTFVRSDGTPMQIVHRDVSPGNIMIDTQGHVKVLDFGIARADQTDEYKTRDGMFKGKLTYAAPEVYDGTAATPKSDVYSAGVVLYQLLAGENPFRGKDMAEIVRRVLTQKLPPISSRREDVSPELDAALEQALAKNPADRHPTASAFADALRAARSRREEEFQTELIDDIWNDFNGDMPQKLGLEPLAVRDAAWRAAQGDAPDTGRAALTSTSPPPSGDVPTQTQPLVEPKALAPAPLPGATPAALAPAAAPVQPATSRTALYAGLAFALGAGAALYLWWAGQKQEAPASRFVVVEKEARDDSQTASQVATSAEAPTPSVAETAAPSAAPSTTLPVSAPTSAVKQPTGTPTQPAPQGKADSATLSRAVQRQRGRIESCFQTHVKELEGRPEVSVRFRVAAGGHVEGADLTPGALAGTPLGQCLIGVAKSTDFGPISEPVTFTIPITARRVK
jgi:eukaryotic-like serine/threonine-protein kinase